MSFDVSAPPAYRECRGRGRRILDDLQQLRRGEVRGNTQDVEDDLLDPGRDWDQQYAAEEIFDLVERFEARAASPSTRSDL